MVIQVNGEPREVGEHLSLSQLVADLALKPEQIAIELNHTVVRRASWEDTLLQADDKIEIVHFVGGGSLECADLSALWSDVKPNNPQITPITPIEHDRTRSSFATVSRIL